MKHHHRCAWCRKPIAAGTEHTHLNDRYHEVCLAQVINMVGNSPRAFRIAKGINER